MSCYATKATKWGLMRCCLSAHDATTWHRAQFAEDGAAYAVEWGDQHRRVGFAELNGLQTVLSVNPTMRPAELALALAGWLAEHDDVRRELVKIGDIS